MALMKTSNPALGDKTFTDLAKGGQLDGLVDTQRMTLSGTVNKTGILLLCCIATAAYTWRLFLQSAGDASAVGGLMIGGLIGGFIFAMVTIFKKEWAPVTAPIYALLEGLVLGGISRHHQCEVSGHRHPGGFADLRHAAGAAAGVQFGPDQGNGEVQAGDYRGHRRHCGVLRAGAGAELLPHLLHRDQRQRPDRDRLQRGGGDRRGTEPGAGLRLHRAGRQRGRGPSIWSGTARSALWSRWCGCISRFCGCCLKCAAGTEAGVRGGFRGEGAEGKVPGAKARFDSGALMPGLKSRPIKKRT